MATVTSLLIIVEAQKLFDLSKNGLLLIFPVWKRFLKTLWLQHRPNLILTFFQTTASPTSFFFFLKTLSLKISPCDYVPYTL